MSPFKRLQGWLREQKRTAQLLEAERVRYRDQGELRHADDRADISEWGHAGT